MTKTALLSLLALGACLSLYAQTPDYRYGKVSAEECRMTRYDPDPDAEAVYLHEDSYLYYQFTNDITVGFDYRARIKILKPEGSSQADIAIPYVSRYTARETIYGLEAAAYNYVDGKVVKTPLKKQYIFTEEVDENRKIIKFSIPDVRVGTVIEYRFRRMSKNLTNIPSIRFQHDIPVAHSHMFAQIPEFFRFNTNLKGYVRIAFDETTTNTSVGSGDNMISFTSREIKATSTDIPALKREAYV